VNGNLQATTSVGEFASSISGAPDSEEQIDVIVSDGTNTSYTTYYITVCPQSQYTC
jgi:hypothetical protein